MKAAGSRFVEILALLLERNEREAVLGDVIEAEESTWQASLQVAGVFLHRQAAYWRGWRPWLAAFGLSLPSSLLLMGLSLSVSLAFQRLVSQGHSPAGQAMSPGLAFLACQVLLLVGWSWTMGFAVGSVSRPTLWVSLAASCAPCLFCLARFRVESLSRFCLLIFLIPAVWGVCKSLGRLRPKPGLAMAIAVVVTLLMIPAWSGMGQRWWSLRPWVLNWILTWPAWYVVWMSRVPRMERKARA